MPLPSQATASIDIGGVKKRSAKKKSRKNSQIKEGDQFKITVEGRKFIVVAGKDEDTTLITEVQRGSHEGSKSKKS